MILVDDQPEGRSLLNLRSLQHLGDRRVLLQQIRLTQSDQLHASCLGILNRLGEAILLAVSVQELGQADLRHEPPRPADAHGQEGERVHQHELPGLYTRQLVQHTRKCLTQRNSHWY